jgi:predicted amidohydrolase YtcJ
VALALGSDAPVTPLDPWGGVHAAVDHRTPGQGLRPFDAFDAATYGGWYAVRAEHGVGPLAVGAPADLALWATEDTLSAVLGDRGRPRCAALLVGGQEIGTSA